MRAINRLENQVRKRLMCTSKPSKHYCPGQYVKRYPSGVRLHNRKVLSAPGPRTKYFKHLLFRRSINYIHKSIY